MNKVNLHPKDYRPVVFSDEVAGFSFLTKSTAVSDEVIKWKDGKEYPVVKTQISSASHPFFTGEEKIIDTEGRVDRFKALQDKAAARRNSLINKADKKSKRSKQSEEKQTKASKIGENKTSHKVTKKESTKKSDSDK